MNVHCPFTQSTPCRGELCAVYDAKYQTCGFLTIAIELHNIVYAVDDLKDSLAADLCGIGRS